MRDFQICTMAQKDNFFFSGHSSYSWQQNGQLGELHLLHFQELWKGYLKCCVFFRILRVKTGLIEISEYNRRQSLQCIINWLPNFRSMTPDWSWYLSTEFVHFNHARKHHCIKTKPRMLVLTKLCISNKPSLTENKAHKFVHNQHKFYSPRTNMKTLKRNIN